MARKGEKHGGNCKELAEEIHALREEVERLRARQLKTEETCRQLKMEKSTVEAKLSKLEASVMVAIPPFSFTLHNFSHCKKHSLRWRSPPFYSNPWGYKLAVEVVAGGDSVGEGTHVSVYIHVLKGEFDKQQRWPFRGSVTLQLLNERREGGHFEKVIEFTDDTPLVNSGLVGEEGERGVGWGDPLFISHTNLQYNPTVDTEFVQSNRLCFLVTKVETVNPQDKVSW